MSTRTAVPAMSDEREQDQPEAVIAIVATGECEVIKGGDEQQEQPDRDNSEEVDR